MRGVSRSAAAASAILILAVALGSLYYPRANRSNGVSETLVLPTPVNTQTTLTPSGASTTRIFSSTSTTSVSSLSTSSTTATTTTITDSQVTITIIPGSSNAIEGPHGQYFSPASVTILVGATVTWVNKDNYTHGVDAYNGAFFEATIPPRGGTFSYTFVEPGTFSYHCTIHAFMGGEIVVVQG